MLPTERIKALSKRCKAVDDKLDQWNTMTEDEDRTLHEERQTLMLFDDMINQKEPLLTDAGLDYVENGIKNSEEWINEKLAEQGDD